MDRGFTSLQQVLVQEQVGRVTNGLAWCLHTPPQWWAEVATEEQRERWLRPAVRGERHECYAITEEHAGTDVSDLATTARLATATHYVVNGTKWHVTSYNLADYCFVQAVLTDGPHAGEHVLLVVDLPSPGIEVVRTPAYSHNIADHHPIVSFTDVRIPASQLIGREGEGMTFTQDWFRFERVMVAARCVGAASRLVDEMTAFAGERDRRRAAARRLPAGHRRCSPTPPPSCTPPGPRSTRPRAPSTPARTARCSTPAPRWSSCSAPRWPAGSPTARSRCSAAAATCARTSPSGCSASCASSGSGRAPREIQRVIVGQQLLKRGPAAVLGDG